MLSKLKGRILYAAKAIVAAVVLAAGPIVQELVDDVSLLLLGSASTIIGAVVVYATKNAPSPVRPR